MRSSTTTVVPVPRQPNWVLNDGIVASRNRVATALDQFANFKCELPHLSRQLDARGESHCINAPSRLRARRSLVHSPANAALVSFISDGTFSSVTNCTGGSPGCSITDSGNVLRMSGASNQNQPSTLTITDITAPTSRRTRTITSSARSPG